jgi:hypothetical protein
MMLELRPSPVPPPERQTELNLVKAVSEELTNIPSRQSGADRGVAGLIEDLIRLVKTIGTYGLPATIFALPLLVACFGLYFLYVGVNAPAVNMARVWIGGFTLLFGSGFLMAILHYFEKHRLWEKIKSWQPQKTA